MSKEESKSNKHYIVSDTWNEILMPLQMEWQPKEDITTYELALCMPYFYRPYGVMPYEVNLNDKHLRHFKITDHNKDE